MVKRALKAVVVSKPIKLDIGCGINKKEGFQGMDRRKFDGVDIVHDVMVFPWPFKDQTVAEVHCSNFLEHLDHNRHNPERVKFMNELYRVMHIGAKATIITPHWCSNRAYGDFTHADKPVSEMFYFYVSKKWRDANAPDNDAQWNPDGYTCDFEATWGYGLRADIALKSSDYQAYAMGNYKEVCTDLWATLTRL